MPWYIALSITLFLFVLAPFFRKWVDLVVWPRIADWWASRSRAALQARIAKLEATLADVAALPPLTDFENVAIRGLSGILGLLSMLPLLGLWLYIDIDGDHQRTLIPNHWPSILRLLQFPLMVFAYSGLAMLFATFLENFRKRRSPEYHAHLRRDADELAARLIRFSG